MASILLIDFEPHNNHHTLLTRKFMCQQKGVAKYESSLQEHLQFMKNYPSITKYTPIEFLCDYRIYENVNFGMECSAILNIEPKFIVANDVEFARRKFVRLRNFPMNVDDEEFAFKLVDNNFSLFLDLTKFNNALRSRPDMIERISKKFIENFDNLNMSEQKDLLTSFGPKVSEFKELEEISNIEPEEREKYLNCEDFMEKYGCLINEKLYDQVDLSKACYALRSDPQFMIPFIEHDGMNMRFASILRDNESIVEKAFSNNVHSFQYASIRLRNNLFLAKKLTKISQDALKYIGSILKNDVQFYSSLLEVDVKFEIPSKELGIQLVSHHSDNYLKLPADYEYKYDKEIMLQAPDISMEDALRLYSDDRPFIRKMMSKLSNPLPFLDESCKNDIEIIKECIGFHPTLIKYASLEIRSNIDHLMILIDYCSSVGGLCHLIIYAHYEIKKNKKFALKCVEKFGSSLQYLIYFWNDKEVVMKAVEQDFQSYSFASNSLKLDCDLIKASPKCLFLIPDLEQHPIFSDVEFFEKCITKHDLYLYRLPIPPELRIKKTYLFKNPRAYLCRYSESDKETFLKLLEKKENFEIYEYCMHFDYRNHRNSSGSFLERACKVNPIVNLLYGNNDTCTSGYFKNELNKEEFLAIFNKRMSETYFSAYIIPHKKMKILL